MSLSLLLSPWVQAAFATALLLLLLARRGDAREEWWSSTIELARTIARPPPAARGARRRPPPAVACAAAALLAGGLALGWPRADGPAPPRTWTVDVDASPSLFLPWAQPGELPADGAPTRLERSLRLSRLELERSLRPGDLVLWRRELDGSLEVHGGSAPPASWLVPPARPQPSPLWEALDQPGHLWISDDAGGAVPRAALACLSGGAEVPGPVAAVGRARLTGGPAGLRVEPVEAAAPRLALEGLGGEGALGRVLEAWCAARAVDLLQRPPAELVVALVRVEDPSSPASRAGRPGWSLGFSGPRGSTRGTAWLSDERGALVAWVPGRIEFACAPANEPEGDPAAFAAAWSELLDLACLAPPDVVSTAERAPAGPERVVGSLAEPVHATGGPHPGRAPAGLALAAALLAVSALALERLH